MTHNKRQTLGAILNRCSSDEKQIKRAAMHVTSVAMEKADSSALGHSAGYLKQIDSQGARMHTPMHAHLASVKLPHEYAESVDIAVLAQTVTPEALG
jgi:hypothetical protein